MQMQKVESVARFFFSQSFSSSHSETCGGGMMPWGFFFQITGKPVEDNDPKVMARSK